LPYWDYFLCETKADGRQRTNPKMKRILNIITLLRSALKKAFLWIYKVNMR
jgi:hypothetical protein